MKTRGANIFCSVCRAEPWPDDPAIHETFDLRLVNGEWRCEQHRDRAPKRAPRSAPQTPRQALTELDAALAKESARLDEALAALETNASDDDTDRVAAARKTAKRLRDGLECGLADLRALLFPPPSHAKPATARDRRAPGQTSLLDKPDEDSPP